MQICRLSGARLMLAVRRHVVTSRRAILTAVVIGLLGTAFAAWQVPAVEEQRGHVPIAPAIELWFDCGSSTERSRFLELFRGYAADFQLDISEDFGGRSLSAVDSNRLVLGADTGSPYPCAISANNYADTDELVRTHFASIEQRLRLQFGDGRIRRIEGRENLDRELSAYAKRTEPWLGE
jgi:hypothetical protein